MKAEKLDFLINELMPSAEIPKAYTDKWRLFRSLVNAREPKPVSSRFLSIQDELLKTLIAERGITDIRDLQPIKDNMYLWKGDIITLRVDGIVNAANNKMLGCFCPCHGCIDNAIHTFAGVQLRLECAEIMKKQGCDEPTGNAKMTRGYNLPCKHILHTVGPIVGNRLTEQDCKLLADCYRSCLALAVKNELKSIAFCCISTGEFHFPNDKAAEIAIATAAEFHKQNSNIRIVFNVFKDIDFTLYHNLLICSKS